MSTVHWRPDGTPASARYGDIYRSAAGGLAQARHVFLRGCGLLADSGTPADWAGRAVWQILETGFGLGLNFLAAWHAWLHDPQRPARLFYSAVEAHPPEADDLLRSAAPFPELHPLAEPLAAHWRGLLPGVHRIELASGALQLTLAVGDALPMLDELTGRFDSMFLDGFSPEQNPAMWSDGVLRAAARLCRPGARAATWCVAGEVRQRLAACGFRVERVPGLPPKRHALVARYAPGDAQAPPSLPQHLSHEESVVQGRDIHKTAVIPRVAKRSREIHAAVDEDAPSGFRDCARNDRGCASRCTDAYPFATPFHEEREQQTCAIVGAGLAGASLAYSLATRGWQVTVLGLNSAPADGASALPAGVFAPHVSPDDRPLSRLSRAGCAATLARARALLREGTDFAASGVLERHAPGQRRCPTDWTQSETAAARALSTPASAALRAQTGWPADVDHPALWHAAAGWVRPAELVRAMLAAPGIRFVGNARAARIAPHGDGWRVLDEAGRTLEEAALVALAAGFDTRALLEASFADTAWPLHALRGQIAFGPAPDDADALPPFPVNGHGNLTPAGPLWVLGSTFVRDDARTDTRAAEHAANRQRLAELLPRAAAVLAPQWDDGRADAWAGVRCTVPDRLPMVGPLRWRVEDAPFPPAPLPQAGEGNQHPWLLTALGSRGLTLAVLAGEIAAAWLHDEPLPVERSLAHALRASRFGDKTARRARTS